MKKFIFQVAIILAISIVAGLAFNHFRADSLPLFKEYQPVPPSGVAPDEDLSSYYKEMDMDTLKALMESNMIILLDARHSSLYKEGHLPNAISLPIIEFNQKYESVAPLLVKDKSLVLYCSGITCPDSSLLARELSRKGFTDIYVFKGGFEEWKDQGNTIVTQ